MIQKLECMLEYMAFERSLKWFDYTRKNVDVRAIDLILKSTKNSAETSEAMNFYREACRIYQLFETKRP